MDSVPNRRVVSIFIVVLVSLEPNDGSDLSGILVDTQLRGADLTVVRIHGAVPAVRSEGAAVKVARVLNHDLLVRDEVGPNVQPRRDDREVVRAVIHVGLDGVVAAADP